MVLVGMLSALGVGYALWSGTLYINGTVKTGNVDAEMTLGPVTDIETKDVGECTAALVDLNADTQPEKIAVTITNGYPSYTCKVDFDIHSKGTIPIHVHSPKLTVDPMPAVSASFENCYADHVQLHKSESALCTLVLHVEQLALQNAGRGQTGDPPAYTFDVEIVYHQFNEP
jgi:hypothetical protein